MSALTQPMPSTTEQLLPSQPASPWADAAQFVPLPLSPEALSAFKTSLHDEVAWQEDYFVAYERRFAIPRMQAWFADHALQYRYADNLLHTQPWTAPLLKLRALVEAATNKTFNAVLATLYRNGNDSVGWHADDERELGAAPYIASLSFGATRNFEMRTKDHSQIYSLPLNEGELLLMLPAFQQHWLHRVPAQPEVDGFRINLTFRYVYEEA